MIFSAFAFPGTASAQQTNSNVTREFVENRTYFKIPLDYINVNSSKKYAKFVFETVDDASGSLDVCLSDWDGSEITEEVEEKLPALGEKIDEISVTGQGSYSVDIWDEVKSHLQAEQTDGKYVSNDEYISIVLVTKDDIKIKLSEDAIVPIVNKDFTEEDETLTSIPKSTTDYDGGNNRVNIAKPWGAVFDIADDGNQWARSNVETVHRINEGDNSFVKINYIPNLYWNGRIWWSNLFKGSGADGELTDDDVGRIFSIEFDTKYMCERGYELGDTYLNISGAHTLESWPEGIEIHSYDSGRGWNNSGSWDQGAADRYNNYPSGQMYAPSTAGTSDSFRKIDVDDWSRIRYSWKITELDPELKPVLMLKLGAPAKEGLYTDSATTYKGQSGVAIDNLLVEDITHAPRLEYKSLSGTDTSEAGDVLRYHKVIADQSVTVNRVVNALEYEFVYDEETELATNLAVKGDLQKKSGEITDVDIYILKDGYSAEDYTNEEAVYQKTTVPVEKSGEKLLYETVFSLKNLESFENTLTIVVGGLSGDAEYISDSAQYRNVYMLKSVSDEVMAADTLQKMVEFLKDETVPTNAQILNLSNNEQFNALDDDGYEFVAQYLIDARDDTSAGIINEDDITDISLIRAAAEKALVYNTLNNSLKSGAELVEYAAANEGYLVRSGFTPYERTYSAFSAQKKAAAAEGLNGKDFKYGSDTESVFASCIFGEAKIGSEPEDIIKIIKDNAAYMGIDLDLQYNSLSGKYKEQANEEIYEFFQSLTSYTNLGGEFETILRNIKAADFDDYRYEMNFENLPPEGLLFMNNEFDQYRENNFSYSDKYFLKVDSGDPEITTKRDHTYLGQDGKTGSSLKMANVYASWSGTYTFSRIKLFNTLKNSDLTEDDIGKSYKITFWAYSDKDMSLRSNYFSLANREGHSAWGVCTYPGCAAGDYGGADYKKSVYFDIGPSAADPKDNGWVKCEFEYELDAHIVSGAQIGLLMFCCEETTLDEGQNICYIDDITVEQYPIRLEAAQDGKFVKIYGDMSNIFEDTQIDVDIFDKDGTSLASTAVSIGSDGKYSYDCDLSSLETFYNDLVIAVGKDNKEYLKELRFVNIELTNKKIENIKQADSAEQIKEALSSGAPDASALELLSANDIPYVEKIADKEEFVRYLYEKREALTIDNAEDVILEGVVLVGLNNGFLSGEEACGLIESCAARLGISDKYYYNVGYASLTDKSKTKLMDDYLIGKNLQGLDDAAEIMPSAVIEIAIDDDSVISNEQIADMISKSLDDLEITNWNKYTSLDDDEKKTANDLIVNYIKANGIGTLNETLAAIAGEAEGSSSTPGGKGGGSSSVGKGSNSSGGFSIASGSDTQVSGSENAKGRFADIDEVSWAKESIEKLSGKGIISGYEDNTFRPSKNITRAEFAKLAALTFDIAADENAVISFSDVPLGHWSYGYVAALYSKGIITGMDETKFGADEYITRQDMVTLIYRVMNVLNIEKNPASADAEFADSAEIADYAKEAVSALYNSGIVSGVGNNTFSPLGKATRAEVAKLLSGFVD